MKTFTFLKNNSSVLFFFFLMFVVCTFTIAQPSSPILIQPPTGGKCLSTTPLFEWQSSIPVSSHEILIFPNDEDPVINEIVSNTYYQVTGGTLNSSTTYNWKVRSFAGGLWGDWSEVWSFTTGSGDNIQNPDNSLSITSVLHQNFPNPFNPVTNITFDLAKTSPVKVIVYDLQGREIAKLLDASLNSGFYRISWNATNLPSGVYFYRMVTDNYIETKKLILKK
jgi:hypothetical protein